MPRAEHLQNLNPNRTYAINATLKYLHRGNNCVTGILEQQNAQSKFCIRNKDFPMGQGYDYNFQRCFYSNNGWLYPRNPQTSVHKNAQHMTQQPLQLKALFEDRSQYTNLYLSVALFVVKVNPRKTFTKEDQTLTLDTLTCFGDGALIDVNIWNQSLSREVQNRWVLFDGFKLKFSGPDSMSLTSSVYARMKFILAPGNTQQYDNTHTYKNLSSLYQIRNINEVHALSHINDKLYSQVKVSITDIKENEYLGCNNCRKKLNQDQSCLNCRGEIIPTNYQFIGVEMKDNDSVIYAAIFDQEIQKTIKQWNMQSPLSFNVCIKSKAEVNAQVVRPSHVVTHLLPTAN